MVLVSEPVNREVYGVWCKLMSLLTERCMELACQVLASEPANREVYGVCLSGAS